MSHWHGTFPVWLMLMRQNNWCRHGVNTPRNVVAVSSRRRAGASLVIRLCLLNQLMLPFYLVWTQNLTQAFITRLICVSYSNLICILVNVVVCWEGEATVKSASINQDQKVCHFMREICVLWKLISSPISQWERWDTHFSQVALKMSPNCSACSPLQPLQL